MKILYLEPFFAGSHKRWIEGYKKFSNHEISILSLPGRHWKWRMHGGAITLARMFQQLNQKFDLIIASSMLDLNIFSSLTKSQTSNVPTSIYFHENQLTYPWSSSDSDPQTGKDRHYGFINYASAISADYLLFNSNYHMNSFLSALPEFLRAFPDKKGMSEIEKLRKKSSVLYLGMDLGAFDEIKTEQSVGPPVILWNHRWEYDKNPELFFNTLGKLKAAGIDFKLIVLGESYSSTPPIFESAAETFKAQILHYGYVDDFRSYAELLWKADIAFTTSRQDFFGGSVVEAVYCNCHPILPNRLAYPEHIPAAYHQNHFYDTDDLAENQLRKAVLSTKEIRDNVQFNKFVSKYDWSVMAQQYDAKLARIAR